MDQHLRKVIEIQSSRKESITIILETLGGDILTVERMVTELRYNYDCVYVIVPNVAMSAGTIFALSANEILMDYFSYLGPIDPQIEKDGQLVPALSYLNQFERLNEKAKMGQITSVEYALINKMDPGDLYQFEQSAGLSIELAEKWLFEYMLQSVGDQTNGTPSTDEVKTKAKHIATSLNDHERWRVHGRGINMKTLREELHLPVKNLADCEKLHKSVREYSDLLQDYIRRESLPAFIHSHGYF
ncbi:MAG: serine dehydrogenasease [Bacteroidetes bacterium]|nr:serine dehydrogenasease [Bacteroidota bacterium]